VFEVREKALGTEHPDTLASINNLALVLEGQGEDNKSEKISRRVLDGREKALGFKHPDTLTNVHGLAHLLQSRKQYDDVSILYQRAC
jgi:hypothetical protein